MNYDETKQTKKLNINFTQNAIKPDLDKNPKTKKSVFTSLAKEDLEKYRKIINDPESLIPIDDPLGISRSLCRLCKLDCKG